MLSRRTTLKVKYNDHDITQDISKLIESFSYTDNATGVADSVTLTINDSKGVWMNGWYPEKGDYLKATIETLNWEREGDNKSLFCGAFLIDNPSYSGPPKKVTLDGQSSPINGQFKDVERSKTWRASSFKNIATTIANRSGLKLIFDSQKNPVLTKAVQNKQPDSTFLNDLCIKYGYGLKINNKYLIVYNIEEYEQKEAVAVYNLDQSTIVNYSFSTVPLQTNYSHVKMRYKNNGANLWFSYGTDQQANDDMKIFKILEIAESYSEAETRCLAKLKELRKSDTKLALTVVGNTKLLGGSCIVLKDFGRFSGKYFIEDVTHSIAPGYQTTINARRI